MGFSLKFGHLIIYVCSFLKRCLHNFCLTQKSCTFTKHSADVSSAVVRLKGLVKVQLLFCVKQRSCKHCYKNECTLVWLQKSFSNPWTCLIAPSIELLAQNLHYLHKVVTEECIHFNSKPIQNLFTITFSYSWNNYSILS